MRSRCEEDSLLRLKLLEFGSPLGVLQLAVMKPVSLVDMDEHDPVKPLPGATMRPFLLPRQSLRSCAYTRQMGHRDTDNERTHKATRCLTPIWR